MFIPILGIATGTALAYTALMIAGGMIVSALKGDPEADVLEALEKTRRRNEALAFSLEAGEQRQGERLDKHILDILQPESAISQAKAIQRGEFDAPFEESDTGLLDDVASQLGMSGGDLSDRFRPSRAGNTDDIGRDIFGL